MSKLRLTQHQGVALAAMALCATASPAFAQDVIGVAPVATAFIDFLQIAAVAGICFGFAVLMTGRHTLSGLVTMAIGGLGIAKTTAIAGLFGLGQ